MSEHNHFDPLDPYGIGRPFPPPVSTNSHDGAAEPVRLDKHSAEQPTPVAIWDDEPAGPVTVLAHAHAMIARGCKLVPVRAGSKVPVGDGWQNSATGDAERVRAWLDAGHLYGIAGGHELSPGRHLVIVDLDVKNGLNGPGELAKLATPYGALPDTFTVATPSGGRHLYFATSFAATNSPGGLPQGIDIRGQGGQCVGPGCVGSNGRPYEVMSAAPIADVPPWLAGMLRAAGDRRDANRTPAAPLDQPEDIALARHYLEHDARPAVLGRGNDTVYKVACCLVERGLDEETATRLMWELYNPRCEPPWGANEAQTFEAPIRSAYQRSQNRPASKSTAALAESFGASDAIETPGAAVVTSCIFDPWREVIVPALPQGLLPDSIDRFATEQSTTMGASRSAIGFAALAALSGAVNHATSLRMMRNGGWSASPRLWLLLAGPPSSKKTPIIGEALRPLEKLQAQRWRAWKEHCDFLGEDDEKPAAPARLVAGDVTMEALAGILAGQDRGVLVKRDELAGWIGSMEKYGSGRGPMADRAFWLEAFNGGPYTVDRVTRGSIVVPNLSVSIIGGIQPDRLSELQGLQSDGLLQRFLPVFVEPGLVAEDRPVSNAGYSALIESAASLDAMHFEFDDAALKIAARFRQRTHDLQMAAETTRPGFAQFVGKLDGLFGTLSLLFHVAEGLEHWFSERVTSETAERVGTLFSEFILPHAFEFYGFADQAAGTDKLRKIASWVLTSGRERLTTRDAMREVSCLRDLDAFRIGRELGPLVAGGWLEPDSHGPENRSWKVLPGVLAQFAERRAAEERRKQELARLMNGPRKAGI